MMNRILEHPGVTPPPENTQYVILCRRRRPTRRPAPPASATCPASLNFSEGNPVDYKAKYKQLWGIK